MASLNTTIDVLVTIEPLTFDMMQRLMDARKADLKHHRAFEEVLARMARVRLEKCIEYGESRYEITDKEFNLWLTFSDVHRKYIRLLQQVRSEDVVGLIESYMDMGNYCAAAVQILSGHLPKGEK